MVMGFVSCSSTPKTAEQNKDGETGHPSAASGEMIYLLGMNYEEAKAISAQSLETASGARIAADNIQVLKKDKQDRPIRIRAKGKVFIDMGAQDETKVLCQEAEINNNEATLRGKPVMRRGGRMIEGLEDKTVVYYVPRKSLKVTGAHRLSTEDPMLASVPGSMAMMPSVVTTMPTVSSWTAGPNLILPGLTDVPNEAP